MTDTSAFGVIHKVDKTTLKWLRYGPKRYSNRSALDTRASDSKIHLANTKASSGAETGEQRDMRTLRVNLREIRKPGKITGGNKWSKDRD